MAKCHWGTSRLENLGREGQVMVPETRLAAIRNFIHQKTKKQLQAFLGMTGYYRNFVTRYAENSSSLTRKKATITVNEMNIMC